MSKARGLADLGDNVDDVVSGSAKAYANISTSFVIQGSFNTASVVDNAAGDLSVNFTNAMSGISYTVQANSANALYMTNSVPVTASQYRMRMFNTSAAFSDRPTMSSTHGDLA